MLAKDFVKKNPGQGFPLRKSLRPITSSLFREEMVWAMRRFSQYQEPFAKAILRVMVRKIFPMPIQISVTVKSRFNESRFNIKSRFKERNLVTKMNFPIKKSRFSVMSRFKEWKGADGGHSLNRDFTVFYSQESGIPGLYKAIKTGSEFQRNPHKWSDFDSAQKPLPLDKIAIYIFTLFIFQLFPLFIFFMEYFETQIALFIRRITDEVMRNLSKVKRMRILVEKLKLRPILIILFLLLLLTEGFSALWVIKTRYGAFRGYPFGEYSKVLI